MDPWWFPRWFPRTAVVMLTLVFLIPHYEDLVGHKHCTLNELLSIITESFLPRLYEKYIDLNVHYTSGYKKYQRDIPKYLYNRPQRLVVPILETSQKVTADTMDSVVKLDGNCFQVAGDEMNSYERKHYIVDFGGDDKFCSCTCPMYRRQCSISKHFFAVIKCGKASFNMFSSLYLKHPLNTLDEDLFNNHIDHDDNDDYVNSTEILEIQTSNSSNIIDLPSRRSPFKTSKMNLLAKLKCK